MDDEGVGKTAGIESGSTNGGAICNQSEKPKIRKAYEVNPL
jgi:hypothetical protein